MADLGLVPVSACRVDVSGVRTVSTTARGNGVGHAPVAVPQRGDAGGHAVFVFVDPQTEEGHGIIYRACSAEGGSCRTSGRCSPEERRTEEVRLRDILELWVGKRLR